MIYWLIAIFIGLLSVYKIQALYSSRKDLLSAISFVCDSNKNLSVEEAMEALFFLPKRGNKFSSGIDLHTPDIADEIIQKVGLDPHYDWFKEYGCEVLRSALKGKVTTNCILCYLMDGKNHILSIQSEPLIEILLDSTVNFKTETLDVMTGVFERYGVGRWLMRFFSFSNQMQYAVWAGCSSDAVHSYYELEQLCEYIHEALNQAHQKMLLIERSHSTSRDSRIHSQFLQQVSHDIRSPLNNVKSVLNVFKLEGIRDDGKTLLDVALKNIDAMSEIVETIFEYTSQSAGHLRVFPEDFSLNKYLEDIIQSYELMAGMKELSVGFFVEGEIVIRADPKHLRRVLGNLISNAIKYTTHGTIAIRAVEDGEEILIEVVDTGIGMTGHELGELFKPFSRFQRSLADGAGLGLVVSKQLVEANGGSLTVTSKYGAGSTFAIRLKKGICPAQYLTNNISDIGKSKSVLIVDDDKDWLMSLERSFTNIGFHIVLATGSSEALGLLHLTHFDAVISDLEMKDGGPERFLPCIRSKETPPRVLILSGREPEKIKHKFGDCEVMQKPVEFANIEAWLKNDSTESNLKNVA